MSTDPYVLVPAHTLELGRGHVRVHAPRWQPTASGLAQVCVHGLGGSSLKWRRIAPLLAAHGPLWTPDLAGFGLTRLGDRPADLEHAVDLLRGFVQVISPDRPVLLYGNSMGGLLACTLAGRHPELVAGLVLCGPAVPPQAGRLDPVVLSRFLIASTPGLGAYWLRRRQRWLTPAERVRESLELGVADPDALDADLVRAHVELERQRRGSPHARRALLQATRSLVRRLGPGRRRLWSDQARVRAPALVLQGARDRLVDAAAVRAFAGRRPDWELLTYDDLGHLVMLEDPVRVASDIAAWRRRTHALTSPTVVEAGGAGADPRRRDAPAPLSSARTR